MKARMFRAAAQWWPLAYLALMAFTAVADWHSRSLASLRWHQAAAWATGGMWFTSWLLARRRRPRRGLRDVPPPLPPKVPAPRPARENVTGPYWLN